MMQPTPEFSRPIPVDDIAGEEATFDIEATAGERAALAERFGLVALESVIAKVRLRRVSRDAVRFEAEFAADVTQACVVTLEPVSDRVEESCEILFEKDAAPGPEVVIDAGQDVEPLPPDILDIGELVAVELALSLNPYPRSPSAPKQGPQGDAAKGKRRESPFQILASLRRRP